MDIVIRPFREADRAILRDLTVAGFEGVSIDHGIDERLGPVAGKEWRWRKARDLDRDIDLLGSDLAVALDRETGQVIGYITMLCDRETRIGWIHNLVVGPRARGQGLGRRLLEHALAHFQKAGMTVAKIETLEQNEIGRHLYPSVGFIEVARQIHYAMPLTDRPTDERTADCR
jgi:ribosomal protein S18 acetylase RimI-like enzyme